MPRRPRRRRWSSCGLVVLAVIMLVPAASETPAGAIVPLGQFGDGPGDQAGLLENPRGVAVDAGGRVYASEAGRISVFTPRGAFLRAFGKDVVPSNKRTGFEQCTRVCQAGASGGEAGELSSAAEVAVDIEGLLNVAELANHRISVFNQQGGFVRSFGKDVNANDAGTGFEVCARGQRCKRGERGSGPGELSSPVGVTISPNGILLVAEGANHRVSLFTREGRFLSAFGQAVNGLPGPRSDICGGQRQRPTVPAIPRARQASRMVPQRAPTQTRVAIHRENPRIL
jgi:DNA-binding beta-propeller fold protein YncE